jgi:nitrogen fixation NifU-like protein
MKDLLMDHFMNPRNVGELPDASGVGEVGNPYSGNIVRLFLQIENDVIRKATFKTLGSRAAIATSSILTEMLPGKSIPDALRITEKDMVEKLGNLTPLKRHCGKVAQLALHAALGDYYTRTRGDSTLSQQVDSRIRDPREWSASTVDMDDAAALAGSPL